LFARVFPVDAFEVTTFGNVKACAAFLYGASVEEMSQADLDTADPHFPLGVAIRAVKPAKAVANVVSGFSRTNSSRAAIVSYHRVGELSADSHALCTPPGVFREHVAYIRHACTPIALDDLVRAAASGTLPDRAVAVTLDDGYLDALTTASPILVEHEVPATFFVNSDRLDEEHERWWDVLERVFACQPALPAQLSLRVGGHDFQMPTSTPRERAAALDALSGAAWPLDAGGRRQIVADVLAWSGAPACARASHRVLTSAEIRALAGRPGHTIGAHTVNHLALTCLDAETRRREIVDDKAALERAIDGRIELFSYPYGEHDAATVAAVRDAGFRAAVTVR